MTEEALYRLLPEDGSPIGWGVAMAALSEELGAEIDENKLHAMIIADARILVRTPTREIHRNVGAAAAPPSAIENERHIEPWFERYLWQQRTSFYDPSPMTLNVAVENTARIHGPPGRWTRPDLCMACVARYRYTPSSQFDLFSFELKMPQGCNMLSVHEALAHRATAHFAYLCLYLPKGDDEEKNLRAMLEQAQHHGVGVIRMLDPRDLATYERPLEARRGQPPAGRIDAFVEERFRPANRLALTRWLRG